MNARCMARRIHTKYVSSIAGLVVLALFPACSKDNPGSNSRGNAANAPVPVRLALVRTGDMREILMYTANIKALDEAVVYSRVPGKISEKRVEEGAAIRKGEAIALVDRDEVGMKFEPAPIEAPLSGLVGRIYVDLGTAVTPQTPVALVVNIAQVRAKLDIPEKYLSLLGTQLQAEVSVDAWPDHVFTGRVSKISPVVDQDTRTAPIEIMVGNPGARLKPGMFARVQIVLKENRAVTIVPREALMGRDEGMTAYVVRDKTARLLAVKTGIRKGSELEVLEGLSPGDMVVVMGQQRLRDGATVLVEANGTNGAR